MPGNNNLQKSTENHRFYLAMAFLCGFFITLIVALFGELLELYSGVKDLAGIFSGWITAIVGFYFLQQNTARAQQQAKEATKEASDARKASEVATKRTVKLTSASESNVEELTETIEKQKRFISELISKLDELSKGEPM